MGNQPADGIFVLVILAIIGLLCVPRVALIPILIVLCTTAVLGLGWLFYQAFFVKD